MFIIGIIEAIGSITSIYMIRSSSGVYINTVFGSDTGSDSGSNDIVVRGV